MLLIKQVRDQSRLESRLSNRNRFLIFANSACRRELRIRKTMPPRTINLIFVPEADITSVSLPTTRFAPTPHGSPLYRFDPYGSDQDDQIRNGPAPNGL